MPTKAWYFLSALVATLLGFTVTARAANFLDPADGSLDVARTLYAALTGGRYALAGALVLVAGVSLLRKYGGARWPALHTDTGSALLALGGALGTSMAASLAGGGAFSWSMLAAAGTTAFAAMGGYAALKKILVEPVLKPWSEKAPAALKPLLMFVVYWFEHASDTQPAPPAPQDPSMKTIPRIGAAFLALTLAASPVACTKTKTAVQIAEQDAIACAKQDLGQTVPEMGASLLMTVVAIVATGGTDWQADLDKLAAKYSGDALACAAKIAADLFKPMATSTPTTTDMDSPYGRAQQSLAHFAGKKQLR